MNAMNVEIAALRTELSKHKRDTRRYRDTLERAIGKVIANQRSVDVALSNEIAALREQVETLRANSVRRLPAPRLVGHALSA